MIPVLRIAAMLLVVQAAAQEFTAQFPIDEMHFLAFGGQPHFILNPGHRLVLEGEDAGEQIVLTVTALNQTKQITLQSGGKPRVVLARVVEEREVINGELTEVGRFWYARSIETSDVYFFGEEVDFYFNGEIVGQTKLWEAGVGGALPGIIMPRTFLLGARYHQNQAVAALDGAENVAMGLTMTVPVGTYSNCVQIAETDMLRPETGTTIKTYAPGVGLVNDHDTLLLTDFRLGTVGLPAGCAFAPFSNHPFFPFSPGRRLMLEGTEGGTNTVLTIMALNEIRTVPVTIVGEAKNIPTRVIEERKTANGELVEVSRKFLAQCLETGDVHFFGKEVDRYEGGVIVGHEGSWLTDVDGAEAGIIMPANFAVGARYFQETALGVANDLASNSASGLTVTVPAGTFTNCVRIMVTTSLGTNAREMTCAPGIGLISDHNVLRLTSVTDPNIATGAPVLSIQDAVLLSWPFTDNSFRLQSSSDLQSWVPVLQIPVPVDGRNQISVPRDKTRNYFRLAVP
ncbi:MAG: hypothetical protein L0Y58_12000 [Verrucomicrobia subdivision 3 bacterium]|nr:hypothetical protein [Limisphaerales bacterium]